MVSLSIRGVCVCLSLFLFLPSAFAQTSSPTPTPTPSGPSKQCSKNDKALAKGAKAVTRVDKAKSRVVKAQSKVGKSGDKIVKAINKAKPEEGCELSVAPIGSATLAGDCNGDGEIKTNDVVAVIDVVREKSQLTSTANCDVNSDQVIDRKDVEDLLTIIVGP